jgi:hypothetical protein
MCDQYDPKIIRPSFCGKFYSYNNELYDYRFPHEWAENHALHTGPDACLNCMQYGTWRGVFIGYCANCAGEYINESRGPGIFGYGFEINNSINSIYNTYLKNADFNNIGCIDFMPEHTIEFRNHYYESVMIPLLDSYASVSNEISFSVDGSAAVTLSINSSESGNSFTFGSRAPFGNGLLASESSSSESTSLPLASLNMVPLSGG